MKKLLLHLKTEINFINMMLHESQILLIYMYMYILWFIYNYIKVLHRIYMYTWMHWCFPGGSDGRESAHNAGDPVLIPGSGRSLGKGNSNPLQYSCLTKEPGGLQSRGSQKAGHGWVTNTHII